MVVFAALASGASVATAADPPPIVTIGPASPAGGNTASGTVGSGGNTDACINNQQSNVDPSSSSPTGAATVNNGSCQAAGSSGGGSQSGSSAGGSASGGAQSGGQGSSGGAPATSGAGRASPAAGAVAAADANGLVVAAIAYSKRGVKTTKRLGVLVTLRDSSGRLVRDAIVSIGGLAGAKTTLSCSSAAYTDGGGQATFKVPVTKSMLGKRLLFTVGARTPTASAQRTGSVRLPSR